MIANSFRSLWLIRQRGCSTYSSSRSLVPIYQFTRFQTLFGSLLSNCKEYATDFPSILLPSLWRRTARILFCLDNSILENEINCFVRYVENLLISNATAHHRTADPQYQNTQANKLHAVSPWLPHIKITGQNPAIYRRIQGSLTRNWEENEYCKLEECVMNCWHNSYRNCFRLNIY